MLQRVTLELRRDDWPVAKRFWSMVGFEQVEPVARLRDEGFEIDERPRHWNAARCFVRAPGDHRVELMAAPPPARG